MNYVFAAAALAALLAAIAAPATAQTATRSFNNQRGSFARAGSLRAGTQPATAKAAFPAAPSSTAAGRRSMTLAVAVGFVEPSAHRRFKAASRSCTLKTNNRPRIKSWRPGRSTVLDWTGPSAGSPGAAQGRGALLQAAPRLLKSSPPG